MIKLVLRNAEVFIGVMAISVVLITNILALTMPIDTDQFHIHAIMNLTSGLVLFSIFFHVSYVMFRGWA